MDEDLFNAIALHLAVPRMVIEIVRHPETDSDDVTGSSDCSTASSDTDGEGEPVPVFKGRKRKRDPSKWKRNIRKKRKAAGLKHKMHKQNESEPTRYKARKERRDAFCKCSVTCTGKFTEEEKDWVFESFYALEDHVLQNCTLRGLIEDHGSVSLANGKARKKFVYKIHLCGRTEVVCKKFFLAIHDITAGRLEKKVLKKELSILDGRGKHGKQRSTQHEKLLAARAFINSIPRRQSHYSLESNPNARYLDATWNCNRLYLEYLKKHAEDSIGVLKPHKFRSIFNYDFNLRFGYPRSDKCKRCEDFLVAIRKLEIARRPDQHEMDRLNEELRKHHKSAQVFYDSVKASKQSCDDVFAFCMDFGSNLALPVTNIGDEYYQRQLWIHNLAFHDLKSGQAVMFIYSEHFAEKGPDEVISALKYYLDTFVPQTVNTIRIFADNAAAHNKNGALFCAYQFLANTRFERIEVRYADVGHSRMAADSDFGKIVLMRKKQETIYGPSQWVKIIEEANLKVPFKVVFLEKPCTDNMNPNGKPVVRVNDYKSALIPKMNPKLVGISKIKSIAFQPNANPTILDHEDQNEVGKPFALLTSTSSLELRQAFTRAKLKYTSYRKISEKKLADVKKLLSHVVLNGRENFYNTIPDMLECRTRGNNSKVN